MVTSWTEAGESFPIPAPLSPAGATSVTWESWGSSAPRLLELFSSEGCSSCPPAEAWMARFRNDPNLWKTYVPIVEHVDYWNDLGWTDRWSRPQFTERQRTYAALGLTSGVYTPGFMLQGHEWRGWLDGTAPPPSDSPGPDQEKKSVSKSGWAGSHLKIVLSSSKQLQFQAEGLPSGQNFLLHAAWLGFDLSSEVEAGENSGRHLNHDFVVLELKDVSVRTSDLGALAVLILSASPSVANDPHTGACAVWLSDSSGRVVQALGGDFPGSRLTPRDCPLGLSLV